MRIAILLIGAAALFSFLFLVFGEPEEKRVIPYHLEGTTYQLRVADTPESRVRGLMFVEEAEGFEGMLFLFEESDVRTFWNKNTFVDLAVYWMQDGEVIGKDILPSVRATEEVRTITSPAPVDEVVEIIISD